MERETVRLRRSVLEWSTRGGIAVLATMLGCASVAQSLGGVLYKSQPENAHRLSPMDGRVTAALARSRVLAAPTGDVRNAGSQREAAALAVHALHQDPMAVSALVALGLAAQLDGTIARARHVFAYAEMLSRRDLPTQLWLIEDAVGRGRIADALRHYDKALRTAKSAPDVLYPILASAIVNAEIRTHLATTLATRPPWGAAFVGYVAANGADPRATADLFIRLQRGGVPVSSTATANVINHLLVDDAATAWRYYALARPGADPRVSRDARFLADLYTPSVFDWLPFNTASVTTVIQHGVFDFTVPASAGGTLLQQMQVLPPGQYRIEGHSIGIDQAEGALPYWALTCRDGRELGRVKLPNSSFAEGMFEGRFTVPSGCSVQVLALVARPSDKLSGLTGQIDRVRLSPAS